MQTKNKTPITIIYFCWDYNIYFYSFFICKTFNRSVKNRSFNSGLREAFDELDEEKVKDLIESHF